MIFLRLLPVFLSCLLLGAHFMRAGLTLPMLFCVGVIFLLAVPRSWAARVVQWTLAVGVLEWVRTLVTVARVRHAMGEPWLRAALILAGVAIFTAASLLAFRAAAVRARYGLEGDDEGPQEPAGSEDGAPRTDYPRS